SPLTTHYCFLDFPVLCRRFESAVGKRDQLIIPEDVWGFFLHYAQYLNGQLPNLDLGVTAAAEFDEMPERPGVGRDENLGLGSIGEHTACRLTGQLAAQRPVRLVLELVLQPLRELHVGLVAL